MRNILQCIGTILIGIASQGMAANNCLTFDGTNDWVNTVSGALIPTSGDFTAECWAKCESDPGTESVLFSQGSSGNAFYIGTGPDGNIHVGDGWDSTDVVFPSDGWHHFAVTKSSSDTLLYIDGEQTASLGWAIPNPESSMILWLGRQYTQEEYWQGSLDDLRIWTDVRTADEIKDNMAQLSDSDDADLKIWYPCDQPAGSVSIVDSSGNNYGGNLKNMDTASCWETVIAIDVDQEDSTVGWLTESVSLSGTNTHSAESITWTNAASAQSGSFVVSGLVFQVSSIPLAYGTNLISVIGATADGMTDSDEFIVEREAAPVAAIDLLTANQTVSGDTDSIDITGTNNQWIVGTLNWTNSADTASEEFPVSGVEFHVSSIPLAFGANIITVSGTNILGEVTRDSVRIFRDPQHHADSPEHYVSPEGGDVWPYTSWATAANTIQDAVDAALTDDTVWVTNGTYSSDGAPAPSDECMTRVCITNAIAVRSANGPDVTTILGMDGDISNLFEDLQSNPMAVARGGYIAAGASFSGFTVSYGLAVSVDNEYHNGGGLYLEAGGTATNCNLVGNWGNQGGGAYGGTVIDCSFIGNLGNLGGGAYGGILIKCSLSANTAATNGGGICSGTLTECTLSSNIAVCAGGGAYDGNLSNCTLTGNSATTGGGAYESILTDCILNGNNAPDMNSDSYTYNPSNTASYVGGGAYGGILTDCTLSNNSAFYGGGVSDSILTDCTLRTNSAQYGGGAMQSTLADCILIDNWAAYGGGAMEGTLTGCRVSANRAVVGGGAMEGTLFDCILTENRATLGGGGAYNSTLNGCTIVENFILLDDGGDGGGVWGGNVQNCIVWDNTAAADGNDIYKATVSFSCASDGLTNGVNGCMTYNPRFTDQAGGNYTLSPFSYCINAGNNSDVSTDTDFIENSRITYGVVDMGAYEYDGIFLGDDPDYDYDGIPDTWEGRYFNCTVACDPDDDCDGDPFSNEEEYIAGTDPTDAASFFCVTNCAPDAAGFRIEWESVSGRTYSIWQAASLTNSFTLLTNNIPYPQSSCTVPADGTNAFFRVQVEVAE